MAISPTQSKGAFFTSHIFPVLFIFLIPGFSAWFFSYAETWMDGIVLKQVVADVSSSPHIEKAEKPQILEFFNQTPVSRIMASNNPEMASFQEMFAPSKARYATFRWMKRISWICLGAILATFVIVGASVAYSFRSQSAQYLALRVGWPVLRTSAAIQVLGQAVLLVALSFWITAIVTESYFIKLIAIAGMLAVLAVVALWKAIFARIDDRCEVSGEIVSEEDAPSLWQRVRDMASKLNTSQPDRIIVGIDPSFFVTEHPVALGDQIHAGRTLYLSLPMLKVLAVDEADAVLGHELAHFSGQDTLWARKISPLTGKFALYLQALSNGLSLIVAHFMLLFWKLYSLSIRRLSRAREFRADQIGAELVSKEAMKRALVKITCYCEYRAKTEQGILEKERVDQGLNLSVHLEQGYPAFLSSFSSSEKAIDETVPHPFDTHPTLNNRLEQLGFEARAALRDLELQQPAVDSWYQAISTAPALEAEMWAKRQAALQAMHSEDLAWRLLPKNAEEEAIVRDRFPNAIFRKRDGAEAKLEFDRIQLADWSAPIFFKDIVLAVEEEAFMKKRFSITHRSEGNAKTTKTKFDPYPYIGETGDLLTNFALYYSRHKTAEERKKAAWPEELE